MTRARIAAIGAALLSVAGGGIALSHAGAAAAAPDEGRRLEELTGSIGFLERRLAADPENFVAGRHLVDRYLLRFQLGANLADLERAEEMALALLEITPDRAGALARLSNVHLAQHEFAAALDAAEEAVRADGTSDAALASLFDAAFASGRYDEAEAALRRLDRQTVSGRIRVAHWLAARGEIEGAYDNLQRACSTLERAAAHPQSVAWCLTELAGIQGERESVRAARTLYQRALRVQPGYRGAIEGLADLAHAGGDWAGAERLYSSIAADAHPDLYLRLAEASRGQGDDARARREESRFLRIATAPGAEALYAHPLALFHARSPETLDLALGLARRDVARRPTVESYDVLAWVHFRRGELARALAASDRARAWGSPSPTMDYHRALILEAMGRGAEAEPLRAPGRDRPELLEPHLRVQAG